MIKKILTRLIKGYTVWKPCNIYNSRIGKGTQIGAFCDIGRALIGRNSRIGSSVTIPIGTVICDNVFIGPNTSICNDKYPSVSKAISQAAKLKPVIVCSRANIGANCTILPGIRIGKGTTIGAGSTVTKDVPDKETWCGNPATRLR